MSYMYDNNLFYRILILRLNIRIQEMMGYWVIFVTQTISEVIPCLELILLHCSFFSTLMS